jgi:peptidoglycan/LPS O-acetylase OafA/YrhL
MAEAAAKGRIVAFDGLRGVAAISVICMHTTIGATPARGFLAVDVFFLLSGFVIAGAYETRLKAGAGLRWFFRVRIARLYPLYAFGMLLGCLSLLSLPGTMARAAAFNIFFLPDLFPTDRSLFPLNGPAWSLCAEVAVNLHYAFGGYRLSTRALAAVVALAGAVLAAVTLTAGTADLGWHQTWIDLAAAASRVMFGFPLGVMLYRLHQCGRIRDFGHSPVTPLVLTLAMFFISIKGAAVVDPALILVATPALFLLLLTARAPSGGFKLVCKQVGRLSYPLYVVHFPLISLFNNVKPPLTLAVRLMQIPKLAPIFLMVALGASLWIEPRGRRWLNRVLGSSPAGEGLCVGVTSA